MTMLTEPLSSLPDWLDHLGRLELPVLNRTRQELAKLKQNEDRITGRDVSRVVLHDPFMTLRVLRYLQEHPGAKQQTEVTTISHALMMLGISPFFRQFDRLEAVEDVLAGHPAALNGLLRVVSRARHAALYAQDWSQLRHDIESDEVLIGALLHDLAEMLLWVCAPTVVLRIRQMMAAQPGLRSVTAQTKVLGFPLLNLQRELVATWHLPAILRQLMDDSRADTPRVQNVMLAVALSRHSANGWYDAALPDDYAAIQQLLALSAPTVMEHLRRVTLSAAKEWEWYGVPPAATWWPMLPRSN